jgi:hypothetical protein
MKKSAEVRKCINCISGTTNNDNNAAPAAAEVVQKEQDLNGPADRVVDVADDYNDGEAPKTHTLDKIGEKIHAKAHDAKVDVKSGIHKIGEVSKHLADKADRFFKVFTHTRVERRFNHIQGYLLPYPVNYRPRIPADVYSVAPMDIFT